MESGDLAGGSGTLPKQQPTVTNLPGVAKDNSDEKSQSPEALTPDTYNLHHPPPPAPTPPHIDTGLARKTKQGDIPGLSRPLKPGSHSFRISSKKASDSSRHDNTAPSERAGAGAGQAAVGPVKKTTKDFQGILQIGSSSYSLARPRAASGVQEVVIGLDAPPDEQTYPSGLPARRQPEQQPPPPPPATKRQRDPGLPPRPPPYVKKKKKEPKP